MPTLWRFNREARSCLDLLMFCSRVSCISSIYAQILSQALPGRVILHAKLPCTIGQVECICSKQASDIDHCSPHLPFECSAMQHASAKKKACMLSYLCAFEPAAAQWLCSRALQTQCSSCMHPSSISLQVRLCIRLSLTSTHAELPMWFQTGGCMAAVQSTTHELHSSWESAALAARWV